MAQSGAPRLDRVLRHCWLATEGWLTLPRHRNPPGRRPMPDMPAASRREPPNGRVVTFFSYKGGTGPAIALAHVARDPAPKRCRGLAPRWELLSPRPPP